VRVAIEIFLWKEPQFTVYHPCPDVLQEVAPGKNPSSRLWEVAELGTPTGLWGKSSVVTRARIEEQHSGRVGIGGALYAV
jgi:hypothetical protein